MKETSGFLQSADLLQTLARPSRAYRRQAWLALLVLGAFMLKALFGAERPYLGL